MRGSLLGISGKDFPHWSEDAPAGNGHVKPGTAAVSLGPLAEKPRYQAIR